MYFIHICIISLAAMESTQISAIDVLSALVVEGTTNVHAASSILEVVSLGHDDTSHIYSNQS